MGQIPLNPRTQSELRKAMWEASKADSSLQAEVDALEVAVDAVEAEVDAIQADYVSATAPFGVDNTLVQTDGLLRKVDPTGILTANVVQAAAAFAATGKLIESATTGKSVQVTSINTADVVVDADIATMVTATNVFANDNRLLRSDGAVRGAQASGVFLTDTDQMGIRAQEYEVGTDTALFVDISGSATSDVIRGIHARSVHNVDSTGTGGAASTAIWGEGKTGGSANLDHIVGVQAYADHESSGTLNEMFAVNARLFSSHLGVISNMYGVQIVAPSTGAVNITNAYGLFIGDFGAAGGTLSYSIYCGTGLVHFGGAMEVESSITATGNIGAGLASGTTPAQVLDTEVDGVLSNWQNTNYFANSNGPRVVYRKANGTRSSPGAVVLGDTLGVFAFAGYRNSAFPATNGVSSALFECIVHGGAVSGSSVPSAFTFATTETGNTNNTLRLFIDSVGGIGIIDATTKMPTTHTRCLVLQAGTALASLVAGTAGFHVASFGPSNGEMYVTNSEGVKTMLTDVHIVYSGYGVGTNYTLTATPALVARGTTNSATTLVLPGEYNLRGQVTLFYNAATFVAGDTITLKLRNTTAGADITNATVTIAAFALTAFTGAIVVPIPEAVFTSPGANRVIQIFASVSTLPLAGSLEISADSIIAYKRQ